MRRAASSGARGDDLTSVESIGASQEAKSELADEAPVEAKPLRKPASFTIASLRAATKFKKAHTGAVAKLGAARVWVSNDDDDDDDDDDGSSFVTSFKGSFSTPSKKSSKKLLVQAFRSPVAASGIRKVRTAVNVIAAADYMEDMALAKPVGETPHDYMIHPHSTFRVCWDVQLALLLGYVAVGVPYRLSFDVEARGGWAIWEYVIDGLFCTDILLNFRTGFVVTRGGEDVEISDPWRVAKSYLGSWFALDFVSSVPWGDVFDAITKSSSGGADGLQMARLLKVGKVLKVLKLLRLSKFSKLGEERGAQIEEVMLSSWVGGGVQLLRLLGVCFIVCHYLACGWASVSAARDKDDTSWLKSYADGDDGDHGNVNTANFWAVDDRYLVAMYWALTTMTTVGYGDICPESNSERIFCMVAMVIGGAFYGYLIASIATIVTATNANEQQYYERMDQIHAYMKCKNFPPALKHRVHRYFKRYFTERTALDENAILNDLEPALRQDVATFLIHDAVRKNYLFRELDAPMLSKLFAVFKPTSADTGMELVTRNQPGQTMFVIQNGSCQRKMGASGLGQRRRRRQFLHEGGSFGELVALGLEQRYSHSVVATERCDLYLLAGDDLRAAIGDEANVLDLLKATAQRHYDEEAEDDDALANDVPASARVTTTMGSTLVGGGASTLPTGFADNTTTLLNDIFDEVAISRDSADSTQTVLRDIQVDLAALRDQMRQLAKGSARHERRLGALERANGGAPSAEPAEGRESPSQFDEPTVQLGLSGRWLKLLDKADGSDGQGKSMASSDPYIRIVRVNPAEPAGGAELVPDEWAVDPLRIAWTSEVARNSANPDWKDAVIALKELCGGKASDRDRKLVIQCWDWDRKTPHDFIGAVVVTLAELLRRPSLSLEGFSEPLTGVSDGPHPTMNQIVVRKCQLVNL